jgi:dTDP-glucose 4,6-dehydratase
MSANTYEMSGTLAENQNIEFSLVVNNIKISTKLQSLKIGNNSIILTGIHQDTINEKLKIDIIVNFAAESHVDNSINNPSIFLDTNIYGVLNLLELCKKHKIRFHQVSTDEVYGPVDPYKDNVDENFKYNPSSPYSVSKTSADLLVLSYIRTYNINATISRCTNNFGPYQHPEKLIPKVITNVFGNIKIPVYGDGKQIRNWIYVDDHCQGILNILESGRFGEIFNIGSDTLIPNIDVIKEILKQLNKNENLISFVKDRPGHDFAYHLNSNKIKELTGWKESSSFQNYLTKTIDIQISMYPKSTLNLVFVL